LAALSGPIQFASRKNFAFLERVVDLKNTVQGALERAREAAPNDEARQHCSDLLEKLPPDQENRDTRIQAWRRVLDELDKFDHLRGASPTESTGSPHPNALAKKPDKVRATSAITPVDLRRLKKAPPPIDDEDAMTSELSPAKPVKTLASSSSVGALAPLAEPKIQPTDPIQFLKGVGPRFAELLGRREVRTVEDLLRFLPRRYEDRRLLETIGQLQAGSRVTVCGEVLLKELRRRGRNQILEVVLGDSSGTLNLTWFRVPKGRFADRFQKGFRFRVSGEVKRYRGRLQITHPETKLLEGDREQAWDEPQGDSLVPVYLEVEQVRPVQLRAWIKRALPAAKQLSDYIPATLLAKHDLPKLDEALVALHQPPEGTSLETLVMRRTPWHKRLIYGELLCLQCALLSDKLTESRQESLSVTLESTLGSWAERLFSFELTGAQKRVLGLLEKDLAKQVGMNRLLQGDVGSGKTAVAFSVAAAVADAGYQVALMAPTEILAEQHFRSALKALVPVGIKVGLLTGSLSATESRQTLAAIADGSIQVVLGTHALIQDKVVFKGLALAIVDEQHRFGVLQRGRFNEMGVQSLGRAPHMLVMTATPIPRTLALTVYGDLDVALLDELPPGRQPINTQLFRENQRHELYRRLRDAVEKGRQAYVVFPLVEESDKEGMEKIRDATSAAEELAQGPLAGLEVGLLHGRMSGDDKDRMMRRFIEKKIQVLVATTVIEVGVDVANATVMVIEHAERFGLSQLHQLRGRVGRGRHASECLLLAQYTASEDAWQRLMVMTRTQDGFEIAEEDLQIRGPGDFVGTRQSGMALLSVANLLRDGEILAQARDDARRLLEQDPGLDFDKHRPLGERVKHVWRDRLQLARVG
jgi:ATP-dependent DNA helicase RecG